MPIERRWPQFELAERDMLLAWLEFHRATLEWKCAGLSEAQLKERAVPPSTMSLLGLVRHCTEVERNWFQRVLQHQDIAGIYYTDDNPDGEFDDVETGDVDRDFAIYHEACDISRAAVDAAGSLDVTGVWRGDTVSLRWILTHLIEEYARHNGHADLLRERIDGQKGF